MGLQHPPHVVDDVVSTAQTLDRVWTLLERLGTVVTGSVVAMRQGTAWRRALGQQRAGAVAGVFDTPRLRLRADGWWPE